MDNEKLETEEVKQEVSGILEVLPDGFGFLRGDNYLTSPNDVYLSNSQIRRFNLRTGDFVSGLARNPREGERFKGLLQVLTVNNEDPEVIRERKKFDNLTPTYPNQKIHLEDSSIALRLIDLLAPIGKGQRGLIVSPPKAGKTTLIKEIALSIMKNNKDIHVIILLIDERPEEVTDIKDATKGNDIEVIYSTFDELPEKHAKVAEMTIERAKRMVESGNDVVILLDSITRLARSYNLLCTPSGRTLSGGLDPNSLYMPKRFLGSARNTIDNGSLTIIATALVDTGSKMDDVIFEEFKGTGNMEIILTRELQEKRIFPAIDINKSGTRKEELLLSEDELIVVNNIRKSFTDLRNDVAVERLMTLINKTKNNEELIKQTLQNIK